MTYTSENTADSLEAIDALLRFAVGMDTDDQDLIASAFTADTVVDFTAAAEKVGMNFPVLNGLDQTIGALGQLSSNYVTSHTVSNARVQIGGDEASIYALVEAQHLPNGDLSRNFLMKNEYRGILVRIGQEWKISDLKIANLWAQGDVRVMTGG
jgi:hypothetical protein